MFAVLGLMNFLFAKPIQIKLRKIKRKQNKKKIRNQMFKKKEGNKIVTNTQEKDEESKGIFDNFTFPFLLAPAS